MRGARARVRERASPTMLPAASVNNLLTKKYWISLTGGAKIKEIVSQNMNITGLVKETSETNRLKCIGNPQLNI